MVTVRKMAVAVAIGSIATVLAACGSSSSSPSTSSAAAAASSAPAASAAASAASTTFTYTSDNPGDSMINGEDLTKDLGPAPTDTGYRIAVVLKALTNQYWQGIEAGAKAAAEKYGVDMTLQAASSESSQDEQLSIAQTLVAQGFDGYVVAPESTSNLNPALDQMMAANAPIVNVDDARVPATTYVGPDHQLDGTQAAQECAMLNPDGAQVAQIEGQAGSSAAQLRIKGFKEGVAAAGNLELVASVPGDWDADKAFGAANQIIGQYPDLKCIYANNDTMAIGVAKAVEASGKDIAVIGTDGVPEAVAGVRDGSVHATISPLPFYQGFWAVESAVRLLAGQEVPQWVVSPAQLITTDTVDKFYDDKGFVLPGLFE